MIIGKGLIASAFADQEEMLEDVVLFASGVSDSSCRDIEEFEREKQLVRSIYSAHKGKLFVYFSTISILDPSLQGSAYTEHKKGIERALMGLDNTLILRCPNIIGKGGNPKTLINYLAHCIRSDKGFEVWSNAHRNFLGMNDLKKITLALIERDKRGIRAIVHPYSYSISEIVIELEKLLRKKARFSVAEGGAHYVPETDVELMELFNELNINTSSGYLEHVLSTYLETK